MPAAVDFDSLWDFNDAAGSEAKFRDLLPDHGAAEFDSDWHRELLTQIARAKGLQRKFDEARRTLDAVEKQLDKASNRVHVRYLLERGRVLNSSKQPDEAKPLFLAAWTRARAAGEDAFAVDAAHMLGIVETGDAAIEWNRKALELAERSTEPKARKWAGSLHNNLGWSHHGSGDFDEALHHFERALECRVEQGDRNEVLIARWCLARCLRSLGQFGEALAIQEALAEEHANAGTSDGYVFEELAECQLELGNPDGARSDFAKAYAELSQDPWLVDNEPERIDRLRRLGQVPDE